MASDKVEDRDGALVEVKIRSDGVNVLAKAFDINGKPVDLPAKIVFYPQFFSQYEMVRLGTFEVLGVQAGGKQSVFRSALDVSGRSGSLRMARVEEESVVKPFFMNEPRVVHKAAAE